MATNDDLQATFANEFRESIRVGFNWFRFFNEKWPVDLVKISTKVHLSRCFLPWYIGPEGKEMSYDDPDAVPLRLDDVPKTMELLHASRKADILAKVQSFHDTTEVIRFPVPTYGLPNAHYFVLDGNHRLSALTIEQVQFEVTLWNVNGPLDLDCLLDLKYWVKTAEQS